jgi:hypothetical protein
VQSWWCPAASFEGLVGAIEDEPRAVLGDDPDVDPPLTVDQFRSPNVVHVLTAHLAVVCAFVVESTSGSS